MKTDDGENGKRADGLSRAVLCLGSNRDRERNVRRAAEVLRGRFPAIRLSTPVYTEPVGCPSAERFLNQVAVLYTDWGREAFAAFLKRVEADLGRCPADKAAGRVPIDIDLLQWNDQILKADDLRRPYVRDGLREIGGFEI